MSLQLEWFSNASRFSLLEFLNNKLVCFYEPLAIPCVETWAIRSWSHRSSLASPITSWLKESFLSSETFLHQFSSVSQWVLTRNIGRGRFRVAPKPGTSSVWYLSFSQGYACLAGTSLIKGVLVWWHPKVVSRPLSSSKSFAIPDSWPFCPTDIPSVQRLIVLLRAVQGALQNEKSLPCIWHEPVCGSQGTETCSWQTYLPPIFIPMDMC